jgi:hypothetical protein
MISPTRPRATALVLLATLIGTLPGLAQEKARKAKAADAGGQPIRRTVPDSVRSA